MAEISAQDTIAGSAVATDDKFTILDVSDTTSPHAGTGGTLKLVTANDLPNIPPVADALNLRLYVIVCDDGVWADAPEGSVVHWIQPDSAGTSPPEGGRPGREPYDIVDIADAP